MLMPAQIEAGWVINLAGRVPVARLNNNSQREGSQHWERQTVEWLPGRLSAPDTAES
jgi:hypothetical protein